jgi:hypothetical protein
MAIVVVANAVTADAATLLGAGRIQANEVTTPGHTDQAVGLWLPDFQHRRNVVWWFRRCGWENDNRDTGE